MGPVEIKPCSLTLGPVLFNWPAARWRDFYFRIADESPFESVVIGETVGEKRLPFLPPHLEDAVERLRRAGKDVSVATLGLISSDRERDAAEAPLDMVDVLVEANDVSTVAALAGRPHAIGAMINTYNEGTLKYFVDRGAVRVCLPPELPAGSIAALAAATDVDLEVQVFGRQPLAISSRCYHARSRGLSKDGCQFVCADDPDGMVIETLEGEPFLAVNGTQTLSLSYLNLSADLDTLKSMGIRRFRLSPQNVDMIGVAAIFAEILGGQIGADEGDARLGDLCPDVSFSNGFFHAGAGRRFIGREMISE